MSVINSTPTSTPTTSPTKDMSHSTPKRRAPASASAAGSQISRTLAMELVKTPLPLESPWTFWVDRYHGPGQSFDQYAASMYRICSFQTVQSFWRCWNNVPALSELQPRTSYHVMRRDIRPLWEDDANLAGGDLAFKVAKKDAAGAWLHVALSVVGEQLHAALAADDELCGITVSIRKQEDVIKLWTRNAAAFDQSRVVAALKAAVPGLPLLAPPVYNVHSALAASPIKSAL